MLVREEKWFQLALARVQTEPLVFGELVCELLLHLRKYWPRSSAETETASAAKIEQQCMSTAVESADLRPLEQ